MTKLLSTTALIVALGFPALAQDTNPNTTTRAQQQGEVMPGFRSTRGQSDIFASELIGHDVYAPRQGQNAVTGDANRTNNQGAMNADGTHGMAMMNRSDLDDMDQIGQITEVVLTNDGKVSALVIGVGGFLGIGEQDVAVTMDQISFSSDAENPSEMYVTINTSADMLQGAPSYDRTATLGNTDQRRTEGDTSRLSMASGNQATDENRNNRTMFTAPAVERDGYQQVNSRDVSTEMLTGKSVYDINDNDVGSVEDMILSEDGSITNIIIDFGGFLGIGSSQASISYDELTIMTTEGYADVRIYVDATKEQIQGLPRYTATQ